MSGFVDRMKGAALLSVPTFEEVERDRDATMQALGVVVLVAICAGIGMLGLGGIFFVRGIIASLVSWAIWAGLVWLIGTKMLPEPQTRSDWGEIARTTGFAQAPGVLLVLGIIPLLGTLIVLAVNIWMLVAMVIAVRQALDYNDTWRAIAVVVIGWIVKFLISLVLIGFGTMGMGMGRALG